MLSESGIFDQVISKPTHLDELIELFERMRREDEWSHISNLLIPFVQGMRSLLAKRVPRP